MEIYKQLIQQFIINKKFDFIFYVYFYYLIRLIIYLFFSNDYHKINKLY
jgi:hypothetical protein